ncbi:MAG: undecaprenyl-diphosphate phosphatase [Bacillota bacterium]|nr:undecaprenyl-diphosphate phosphatase [Bacillota bacterium]
MMSEFLKVVILSFVEGITEFLPVSSTGHLILVNEFVKLEPEAFSNAFNVIIQLGAIFAVISQYFYKLNPWDLGKISFNKDMAGYERMTSKEKISFRLKNFHKPTMRLWIKVVIGFLPAMVLGLIFDDIIDKYLFSPKVVAGALIFWGIVIIIIEKRKNRKVLAKNLGDLSPSQALKIGFFQCLAMIPGTSRSAATIIGGLTAGTSRTVAAEFSFFLAIPTMLGATTLKIIKLGTSFSQSQWLLIFLGAILSYLVAAVVIKTFMKYIKSHDFVVFGIYRIIVGILVFIFIH